MSIDDADQTPGDQATAVQIGLNIMIRRLRLRLSQQQLADAVGITRNKISAYERGAQNIYLLDFIKIANYFGISVERLIESDS